MTDRTRRITIAILIIVALLAITITRIHALREPQTSAYVVLADRILANDPASERADFSPTYLWLIVPLRALSYTPHDIAAMQTIALTLSALFCASAAHRIAGWPAAIATATLILGNRAAFVIANELDPKTLIFFLTSLAFALLDSSRARRALAGLCLGISAITHPYGSLILIAVLLAPRQPPTVNRQPAPRLPLLAAALLPIAAFTVFATRSNHSSAQFYEGNNVLATGAGGVAPRVVVEMQQRDHLLAPDPIYRAINVDWRAKAIAGIRVYPLAALQRFAWKALLTIHNYDVYEFAIAQRRWIPFGLTFVLAVAALILRRSRRELMPFAFVALIVIVVLTLFVVSARQRNILLAPLAILGGVGAAEILTRRNAVAAVSVVAAALLLHVNGRPMHEHEYLLTHDAPPNSPAVLFDRARTLPPREAEAILATISDYRPARGNTAVSSVAYYRALAARELGQPYRDFVDRAQREAPGDPHVLALAGEVDLLRALHDPLTVDVALREATVRPPEGRPGRER